MRYPFGPFLQAEGDFLVENCHETVAQEPNLGAFGSNPNRIATRLHCVEQSLHNAEGTLLGGARDPDMQTAFRRPEHAALVGRRLTQELPCLSDQGVRET